MRAFIQDVPKSWLEERARLGIDLFDEMWDGVLHMVPPPGFVHQSIGTQLVAFLVPRLRKRGIELRYETGVFRPGSDGMDYRVPDLVFFRADQTDLITKRGIEGAPVAVLEIRSPDDETYEKFDFWAKLGVPEIIVIEPDTRAVEVFRLSGDRYSATAADAGGRFVAASLNLGFSTVKGEHVKLRVECDGASCLV